MFPFDLRYRRFIGIVHNPTGMVYTPTYIMKSTPGEKRYKVHIPELMPFINAKEGIWCSNGNYDTMNVITAKGIEKIYGDNLSIMDGKEHFIIFVENDINSGRILEPTGNENAKGK